MKLKKIGLLEGIVFLLEYCIILLLNYFMPRRAFIWFCIVSILGIVIAYFVVRPIGKKGLPYFFIFPMIIPFSMRFLYLTSDYTYVNGDEFFCESIIIGIVVGILISVIFFWKGRKLSTRVGLMAAFAILFSCFLLALFTNLNYVLDFSDPQYYSAVIEDKDYDHYRRSPDSYEV